MARNSKDETAEAAAPEDAVEVAAQAEGALGAAPVDSHLPDDPAVAEPANQAAPAETRRPQLRRIRVMSAEIGRVGAHEKHIEHPDGEVLVTDEPTEVAATPYILDRVRKGLLIVDGDAEAALGSITEAQRTEQAIGQMRAQAARAERERSRHAEAAEDLAFAANISRAMAHGALGPDEHIHNAEEAEKAAAEHRQQAASR